MQLQSQIAGDFTSVERAGTRLFQVIDDLHEYVVHEHVANIAGSADAERNAMNVYMFISYTCTDKDDRYTFK